MRLPRLLSAASVAVLNLISTAEGATPVNQGEADSVAGAAESGSVSFREILPWSATLGFGFNDDYFSSAIELVAPLAQSPDGNRLLFLYPDIGVFDGGAQSYSLGLGYRVYNEPRDAIFGFHIFWDHTETPSDNGFDALGLGFEYKSGRFEFNFNYSLPEDDIKATGRPFGAPFAGANQILQSSNGVFEAPIEGFNAEIGYLLADPKFAEIRFYIGGYNYFDSPLGGGEISGVHSRLEARLNDLVTLDLAYFEDEEFADGNVYGGIRFSIPLGRDEGAISGLPRGGGVKRRMGEVIHRWSRVTTGASEGDVVALDDVAFVNNGGATAEGIGAGGAMGEDGSAPTPFDDIQEGIDAGRANVVVQGGGMDYFGDFESDGGPDVHLYGQFVGFSGRIFGGPDKAVVNGGFAFTDMEMAGVSYFTINNGHSGSGDGINYNDIRETWTVGNMINDVDDGVQYSDNEDSGATYNHHVIGNMFASFSDGVFVDLNDQGLTSDSVVNVNLYARENRFDGGSTGIRIAARDGDSSDFSDLKFGAWIKNNEFADTDVGIMVDVTGAFVDGATDQRQSYFTEIAGNRFMGTNSEAIDLYLRDEDDASDVANSTVSLDARISDNWFTDHDGDDYIQLTAGGFDQDDGMAEVNLEVVGNHFADNFDDAIDIKQDADSGRQGIFKKFDVTVSENMVEADSDFDNFLEIDLATLSGIDTDVVDPNVYNFMLSNNHVEGGNNGVDANLRDATHATINFMLYGNHFLNQGSDGVRIVSSDYDSDSMDLDNGEVHQLNVTANDNTFEGAGNTGLEIIARGIDFTDSDGTFQLDVSATGNTFLNNSASARVISTDHSTDFAFSQDHLFKVAFRDNDFIQMPGTSTALLIEVTDFTASDVDGDGDTQITLDIAVVGNRFMGGGDAVEVDVRDNDIAGDVDSGDPPAMVTITGNTIREPGDDGIEVIVSGNESSAMDVIISNNFIFDPGDSPIESDISDNDTDVSEDISNNFLNGVLLP